MRPLDHPLILRAREQGRTIRWVARQLGAPRGSLYRRLAGAVSRRGQWATWPTEAAVERLAGELGIEVEELARWLALDTRPCRERQA